MCNHEVLSRQLGTFCLISLWLHFKRRKNRVLSKGTSDIYHHGHATATPSRSLTGAETAIYHLVKLCLREEEPCSDPFNAPRLSTSGN